MYLIYIFELDFVVFLTSDLNALIKKFIKGNFVLEIKTNVFQFF